MKQKNNNSSYTPVDSSPNFPDVETKILNMWKEQNTFQKSIRGEKDYIFYDGPPFANGLPHFGHLLTGFIKDLFARYHTMLGEKVERRFGWDCHGLPAELEAEKQLGISGKKAIEEYGIEKFNDFCKTSVLKYTKEWQDYVNRQARWVDFENEYKTMDSNYMESVLWAFKSLYDKGLIYKSFRVMPYSWACQTPVSDFETRMDNSYREKKSKAITVAFELIDDLTISGKTFKGAEILVWTTTPWTLPSNLAIAVGAEITYVVVKKDERHFIIAKELAEKHADLIGTEVIAEVKGTELVGKKYKPLFPYFQNHENAFQILSGDFVTTEDGTGIVHMAPGFGEDDYNLCEDRGISTVCPVDEAGKFTHPVVDYQGLQVFDANDEIIKSLKQSGRWLKTEQYLHNYPHCWRTDTPLIYKAVPSWYVKVTDIKDKMIANNQKINWIPGHIKNGLFGKWLENARDWSISRNRFWGCPIPIWESDDPKYPHREVYGSIEEISASFGVQVENLHRPFIDTLTKPNPSDPTGKSKLVRVPDVLDCWFESGSMPYAQNHYPFDNKEYFEQNFPADFIVEYQAQTRGWFYTLLVLSTALFNEPPFLNCICHGVILGDGGEKLSKRKKNFADPNEIINNYGADALRWYMISSPVLRGKEIIMDTKCEGVKETQRLIIKPIWNAYNFFVLYANADEIKAEFDLSSNNLMDQYIIAKCQEAVLTIQQSLDAYDTPSATVAVSEFFEVLNNWYIRRSRDRFWRSSKDADKIHAYNTLYSVLHMISRAGCPLLPMIFEEIFTSLTGAESVHLESFPTVTEGEINKELIVLMDRVRDACNAALSIRNEKNIRVRQPLGSVTFIGVSNTNFPEELRNHILDEINVKEWKTLSSAEIANFANYQLKLNFKLIGQRIPNEVKNIIVANKQNDWSLENGGVKIAGQQLGADEYELQLSPLEKFLGDVAPLSTNDALVMLDTEINESLELEGYARDIVRIIQQIRKEKNLNITARIQIKISSDDAKIIETLKEWQGYIESQTLGAVEVANNSGTTHEIMEHKVSIEVL